jgi:hypothetical protein
MGRSAEAREPLGRAQWRESLPKRRHARLIGLLDVWCLIEYSGGSARQTVALCCVCVLNSNAFKTL